MSKKLIILTSLVFVYFIIPAQTLIATSKHQMATANHNQRKIVRDTLDNVYVVFQDIVETDTVIKGLYLNRETEEWSLPVVITSGKNPTLAISKDCKYYLVYESNEAISQIIYRSSQDFFSWTDELNISESSTACKTPVADVDSSGSINVFFVSKVSDNQEKVVYKRIQNGVLQQSNIVFSSVSIQDIAVANHLSYINGRLFLGVQFDQDSLHFYSTLDYFESSDLLFSSKGSNPGMTYNYVYDTVFDWDSFYRLVYIDENSNFVEVGDYTDTWVWKSNDLKILNTDLIVDEICIDDLVFPMGYSFLFMTDGNLYHGFSNGSSEPRVLDSIEFTNPINPSIAYKQFRFSVVDFIWMELNEDEFNIFFKRDDKYIDVYHPYNVENFKTNTIYGFPNPFKEKIELSYKSVNNCSLAELSIYDDYGKLLLLKEMQTENSGNFKFVWDGKDQNGNEVKPGVYVVLFIAGDTKIAGKVVKE